MMTIVKLKKKRLYHGKKLIMTNFILQGECSIDGTLWHEEYVELKATETL